MAKVMKEFDGKLDKIVSQLKKRKDISAQQYGDIFQPVLQQVFVQKKGFCSLFLPILVVVLALSIPTFWAARKTDFGYNAAIEVQYGMQVASRLLAIKMLALYDWTWLPKEYPDGVVCLWQNPNIPQDSSLKCSLCSGVKEVTEIKKPTAVDNIELGRLIQRGEPYVVRNFTINWRPGLSELARAHGQHTKEEWAELCEFESEKKMVDGGLGKLLRSIRDGDDPDKPFYAYWQYCPGQMVRYLRQFYDRPTAVLPPMLELSGPSGVFYARGLGTPDITIPLPQSLNWFSQLKGVSDVNLYMDERCESKCESFSISLNADDMLVIPNSFWLVQVRPKSEDETIIFVNGGDFD